MGKDKEREEEEQKARNFGFIPGTTLHSSYVNKSYDSDARLTTWGSASNLRSSNSYTNINEPEEDTSSYRRTKEASTESTRDSTSRASVEKKPEPELTPYEKYLQRKREQEKKDDDDTKKRDDEKKEEERKRERAGKREEERKKEEEAEKERARKREKERE